MATQVIRLDPVTNLLILGGLPAWFILKDTDPIAVLPAGSATFNGVPNTLIQTQIKDWLLENNLASPETIDQIVTEITQKASQLY